MLDRWLANLDELSFDKRQLEVVFLLDSNDQKMVQKLSEFLLMRDYGGSKLFVTDKDPRLTFDHSPAPRRQRIAIIKDISKELIGNSQFVLGLEDDTLVPADSLIKMINFMQQHPMAGFIQGSEVNRWGFRVLGAWKADNTTDPQRMATIPYQPEGIEEIDAGGFYCYLTPTTLYKKADYRAGETPFGVDTLYSFDLRQQGWKAYIDHSIQCEHYYIKGLVTEPRVLVPDTNVTTAAWVKRGKQWVLENPVKSLTN